MPPNWQPSGWLQLGEHPAAPWPCMPTLLGPPGGLVVACVSTVP